MEAFEEREKMLGHRASILEVEFSKLADHPYTSAQHPDPELARRKYRKVICGDYVCVCKIVDSNVYAYRMVNGKTDYPHLSKQLHNCKRTSS